MGKCQGDMSKKVEMLPNVFEGMEAKKTENVGRNFCGANGANNARPSSHEGT